jgi:hypothetical protein
MGEGENGKGGRRKMGKGEMEKGKMGKGKMGKRNCVTLAPVTNVYILEKNQISYQCFCYVYVLYYFVSIAAGEGPHSKIELASCHWPEIPSL